MVLVEMPHGVQRRGEWQREGTKPSLGTLIKLRGCGPSRYLAAVVDVVPSACPVLLGVELNGLRRGASERAARAIKLERPLRVSVSMQANVNIEKPLRVKAWAEGGG